MIFRWICNSCKKEIKAGKDRLKIVRLEPYENVGDLCLNCWDKIDTQNKSKAKRSKQ